MVRRLRFLRHASVYAAKGLAGVAMGIELSMVEHPKARPSKIVLLGWGVRILTYRIFVVLLPQNNWEIPMTVAMIRRYALGPLEILLWVWAGWKILAVGQEAFMILVLLFAALATHFVRVGWWGGFKLMFRSLRWSGRSLGSMVWNQTLGRISDRWKIWSRKSGAQEGSQAVVVRYAVTATAELLVIASFIANTIFATVCALAFSSLFVG